MGWEKVAKILEEGRRGGSGPDFPTHLQLIIVLLGGTDSNNKVDPVLQGEGV